MSLARSLLQAWMDPLAVLSTSAHTLPHPSRNSLFNKVQELQEHSKNLGDGLNILSGKVCKGGMKNTLKCFAFLLVKSLFLPPFSSRWIQWLRPSPSYPTEEATLARTRYLNWPTSNSFCPASVGTLTKLIASWRSYAAGQQRCNPTCAEEPASQLDSEGTCFSKLMLPSIE